MADVLAGFDLNEPASEHDEASSSFDLNEPASEDAAAADMFDQDELEDDDANGVFDLDKPQDLAGACLFYLD